MGEAASQLIVSSPEGVNSDKTVGVIACRFTMDSGHDSARLVSIVIPCYNAGAYVGEAVESALRQTHEPKEIIVVDDGSTDDSLDAIRSFGDQITWRTGENRGACHARNRGLRLAQGSFVKFLDADNVLCERALKMQVQHLTGLDNKSIVFGNVDFLGSDKNRRYRQPPRRETVPYLVRHNVMTSSPLHRRELLMRVGGFNERLSWAQEYDLHIRLALSGVRFVHHPEVVYWYREHEGPDRIENTRGNIVTEPRLFLKRNKAILKSVKNSDIGFTEDFLRAWARNTWSAGRSVGRTEQWEAAKDYFSAAREVHDECVVGTLSYRSIVSLAGPVVAERLSQLRGAARQFYETHR